MPRALCWIAAMALAGLLGGCGSFIGTGYATVPIQLVRTRLGAFEILDRPDVGRVAISPPPSRFTYWGAVEAFFHTSIELAPAATNSSTSPGSIYFEPLMEYFAQTGRTCRLVRGQPLVEPQWEYVYSCAPGFDTDAITWKPAGYSNAPLPPRP